MKRTTINHLTVCILASGALIALPVHADPFTKADLAKWNSDFMVTVKKGEQLFHSALGSNTVSCDQCHPNASNTHPETYPKFQKQLGRMATLGDMVNWCIQNPAQGKPLAMDDPRMIALQAYITYERRGVPLAPGKH